MIRLTTFAVVLSAALFASSEAASAADYWVVDADGFGDFETLQDAVDVAASGDTIEVRVPLDADQPYAGCSMVGKGLTLHVVGERSASVGPIQIEALPLGATTTLRGLIVGGTGPASGGFQPRSGLAVVASSGSVRIQDCRIYAPHDGEPRPGMVLDRALDVALTDCIVRVSVADTAEDGIVCDRSRLALFGCAVFGGSETIFYNTGSAAFVGSTGGAGMALVNRSMAWVGDSAINGGSGQSVQEFGFSSSLQTGDGGAGAHVEPGSLLLRVDSTLEGGAPGTAFSHAVTLGAEGPPLIGQETTYPGTHRRLRSAASVHAGDTIRATFEGVPGEEVYLLVGRSGGYRFLGVERGVLGVADLDPSTTLTVGIVPPGGVLEVDVALPIVSGGEAETVSLQAAFRTSPTRFRLSETRAISVLGEGIITVACGDRLFVDASAAPGGDGRSWATAARELRDILHAAPPCPAPSTGIEVWIAAGRYTADVPGGSVDRTFKLGSGLRLYGGFAGHEASLGERDIAAHPTILDGDLLGDDATNGTSDNSRALFYTASISSNTFVDGVVFDGLILQGAAGGGAATIHGEVTLRNCVFRDNVHLGNGGGALTSLGSPYDHYDVEISLCRFVRNNGGRVAALFLTRHRGNIELHGCLFQDNERGLFTDSFGGVVEAFNTLQPHMEHIEIKNCTFLNNRIRTSSSFAGVLHLHGPGDVQNNVFWGTHDQNGATVPDITQLGFDPTRPGSTGDWNSFETLPVGWPQDGNVIGDPLFVAPNDPHLSASSPLIDAGNNFAVPAGLTFDLDGNWRLRDDPNAPDTGLGSSRIVDVGAFER